MEGREVVLIEKEASIGTGTSSRSSEVIHAGLYYPTDSLMARACVEGKAMMYDFCRAKHVPHKRIGKLVVATSDE
jgi:L-2-hydroxyglutarate oxidase LhgO